MQRFLKSCLTIAALSSVVVAPIFVSAGKAAAGETGFDGHYVGAGVAAGVTNGGFNNDAATLGGNISGRLQVLDMGNTGISARTQVRFSDATTCINPQVSLDVGIAKNTNAYVAGGYCFIEKNGQPTPLGNKDSATATIGIETAALKDNVVLYGSTTWAPNAYQQGNGSAVSIDAGIGLRLK